MEPDTESFRPIRRRTRMTADQRRAQIAREAAALITRYGSYGFSMQLLADAVGMTLPGLNHYVANRDEVLAMVIKAYYDVDSGVMHPDPLDQDGEQAAPGPHHGDGPIHMPSYLRRVVEGNLERTELVALFMRLAVEAGDPRHPAHAFYRDRHRTILDSMMAIDWHLPEPYRDPERLHDLIVTAFFAMDGVQVQSLTNPDETMLQLWDRAERTLFPSPLWDGYR